jgi:septum formation protein
MTMIQKLILASTSKIRCELLQRAGVAFELKPPRVDESQAKRNHASDPVNTLALHLAKLKALSLPYAEHLVLGADQTLIFEGRAYDKPVSLEDAASQLRLFRGKTHTLQSALAIAQGGIILWTHVSEAHLTMRNITDTFITDYCNAQGDRLLRTVGAYQLEETGIQLFEKIEGDHNAILGLPLLPLLHFLRERRIIAT